MRKRWLFNRLLIFIFVFGGISMLLLRRIEVPECPKHTQNSNDDSGSLNVLIKQFNNSKYRDEEVGAKENSLSKGSDTGIPLEVNCENIHEIKLGKKLGSGVSKHVYLGEFRGKQVAVKMVTPSVKDIVACTKKMKENNSPDAKKQDCYVFPTMKLMKEILLLHQIHHPNILSLLGYCVRHEEIESLSTEKHGVMSVYEYGLKLPKAQVMKRWSWSHRMRTCLEVADLLDYLEHSPLGSLVISDFKPVHFLVVGNNVKLIDMDDVTSLEPKCSGPCRFGLTCVDGVCVGSNAKLNLESANKIFFEKLLFSDSAVTKGKLSELKTRIKGSNISAAALRDKLSEIISQGQS